MKEKLNGICYPGFVNITSAKCVSLILFFVRCRQWVPKHHELSPFGTYLEDGKERERETNEYKHQLISTALVTLTKSYARNGVAIL